MSLSNDRSPTGPIFIGARGAPIKYSNAKTILDKAVARAGFKRLSRLDLLAAYADHLVSEGGLNEIDLVNVLGVANYRQVRNVLEIHRSHRLRQKARAQ